VTEIISLKQAVRNSIKSVFGLNDIELEMVEQEGTKRLMDLWITTTEWKQHRAVLKPGIAHLKLDGGQSIFELLCEKVINKGVILGEGEPARFPPDLFLHPKR